MPLEAWLTCHEAFSCGSHWSFPIFIIHTEISPASAKTSQHLSGLMLDFGGLLISISGTFIAFEAFDNWNICARGTGAVPNQIYIVHIPH